MADERRKVWAAIVYPESLPKDWKDRLERTHIAAAISPLHYADYWTAEDEEKDHTHKAGERKKPHHHIVLYFESLKSPNQVQSILEPLGVSYVEPVESPRAYNRYLCHLDQPEKAQYDPKQIVRLNGAKCDLSKPNPTADEQQEIRREIMNTVRENNITEYCDIVDYADMNGLDDWAWYLEHHTQYMVGYLRSKHYSQRSE